MKISAVSLLVPILGAIVPAAQANFDLYTEFIANPFGTSYDATTSSHLRHCSIKQNQTQHNYKMALLNLHSA